MAGLEPLSRSHADPYVRAAALWVSSAAATPDERDRSNLVALLGDASPEVRRTAALGLAAPDARPLDRATARQVLLLLEGELQGTVQIALLETLIQRGVVEQAETLESLSRLAGSTPDGPLRQSIEAALSLLAG